MATSAIDVDNKLQLWMDIKFFESDNGATGLDLGHHMSSCRRILHRLCQLALGCISVRRWQQIHQIQRHYGTSLWYYQHINVNMKAYIHN